MRMRFVTAAAILLAAGPALAGWGFGGIEGNGRKITEQRTVPAFDRIALRGALDAEVRVGPAQSVAVNIDENVAPRVRTRVENRELIVDVEGPVLWNGVGRVLVTVPTLRGLSSRGSGDAEIEGGKGGDLELETSGSGNIRWRGEAEHLTVTTNGSGDVTLAGRARSLEAATNGSGDLHAASFTVHDADVRTSGSGDVHIAIAGGTLRARTSGSGDVTWSGDAQQVDARRSGSGAIRRE